MQTVREVMTADPVHVPEEMNIMQVAEIMRDRDIGDVIVTNGSSVVGIVTDRDLVVRGLASGNGVEALAVGSIATRDVHAVGPDDPVGTAVTLMAEQAIRRLPVV